MGFELCICRWVNHMSTDCFCNSRQLSFKWWLLVSKELSKEHVWINTNPSPPSSPWKTAQKSIHVKSNNTGEIVEEGKRIILKKQLADLIHAMVYKLICEYPSILCEANSATCFKSLQCVNWCCFLQLTQPLALMTYMMKKDASVMCP
jgi:hypothetical protein